ncbi:MAG: 3-isopropylmalate dehydratase small subunit [Deltaproteobacteria bacterium]|jgi:3-isopropylmalate/(R)-2-methylmalate dehydratase small subunit|nr:3-isopropylmalate dehydratase small subunit [Deltaproteobacteria bacterium]
MESFTTHKGIAAPLNIKNVDTDQIIPKQFLKEISRIGFGKNLFFDWRYLENGEENTDFILNQANYIKASILVAGDNFGCGSSREHAPWAILDFGFKVVVSTSFADIFYNNCFKNSILPIKVSEAELNSLFAEIETNPGVEFDVDLPSQTLSTPGGAKITFEIDAFKKDSMLKGLDDIGWTLQFADKISEFETQQQKKYPWLWQSR